MNGYAPQELREKYSTDVKVAIIDRKKEIYKVHNAHLLKSAKSM